MTPRSSRLADWFRDLRAPLRRFLAQRRGVAPTDLDDIAQEVFLRLLRYDRLELSGEPKSYIFKVAANVAHDWSAQPLQRFPHDPVWLEDLPDEVEPEGELERELRARNLRSALMHLAPRSREILRLHFGEGLTHDAIARELTVTPRVVKRELVRAYATLREELAAGAGKSGFSATALGLMGGKRR